MPRIPPKILDCVCYLYKDENDAKAGREFGGTGFLVAVPSRHQNRHYIYAVTNHHVACTGGFSVVRLNTKDGGSDVFSFNPDQWQFDTRYDIAVVPISLDNDLHKISCFPIEGLLTRESLEKNKLSVGEDVFMVGRFIDHDGGAINQPAARFGNISVMPSPIEQPNGVMASSFCIDLHSRSGYSGSPVFIYRTPVYDLEEVNSPSTDMGDKKLLIAGVIFFALLGIHFAQFPEQWEISSGSFKEISGSSSVPLIATGKYIKGLSGMTCVLPAWCITDVLNSEGAVAARNAMDDQIDDDNRGSAISVPTPESAN